MSNYLPVVHIVDTEGTLSEPLRITFQRIYEMFGLKIKPSKLNLNKILNRQIKLPLNNLLKKEFYIAFNKDTLKTYNSTWKEIDIQSNIVFKNSTISNGSSIGAGQHIYSFEAYNSSNITLDNNNILENNIFINFIRGKRQNPLYFHR